MVKTIETNVWFSSTPYENEHKWTIIVIKQLIQQGDYQLLNFKKSKCVLFSVWNYELRDGCRRRGKKTGERRMLRKLYENGRDVCLSGFNVYSCIVFNRENEIFPMTD